MKSWRPVKKPHQCWNTVRLVVKSNMLISISKLASHAKEVEDAATIFTLSSTICPLVITHVMKVIRWCNYPYEYQQPVISDQ